ncbi:MAG: hypothetical protein H7Y28_15000 [Rhodoferax sp.]|nr:hypothetical protein [Rhodoferax sp.]
MKPEKPQNPGAPKPSSGKPYDALLDPLPLPDVVESDSDTAWGLWQDSLHSHEDGDLPAVPAKDPAYDDTEPMDLTDPDPKK